MANSDEIARGTLILDVQLNNNEVQAKAQELAAKVSSNLNKVSEGAKTTGSALQQAFSSAASVIGKSFTGAVTLAAGGLVTLALRAGNLGVNFNIIQQKARGALTAILQSGKAASDLLGDVNKLNDTSPFPREVFIQAAQQLAAFGVEAKKIPNILDGIQQAVASIGGSSSDILQINNSLAQVAAQGHLTGDALFTLGQKGINAAQIIGDAMGITAQQVKDKVSQGAIGADKALTLLATGLQTKFKGATDTLRSTTVTGALDSFRAVLRNIGGDLSAAFINPFGGGAFIEGLNNITDGLSAIRKVLVPVLLPAVQQLANLFIKVSQEIKSFGQSLTTSGVSNFVNDLKILAPLLTFIGANALGGIVSRIPLLAGLTRAFNPAVLAITALLAPSSKFREALTDLIKTITPIAVELFPKLLSVGQTLSDIFVTIATAVVSLANVFAPLLKILNFGPVTLLLEAFIAKLILAKVTGTGVFQGLAVGIQQMALGLKETTSGAGTLGEKFGAVGAKGKEALAGVGSGLAGLISPTTLVLIGFAAVSSELARSKEAARQLAEEVKKGLNLSDAADRVQALSNVSTKLAEAQERFNKANANATSPVPLGIVPTPVLKFFAKNELKDAKKALTDVQKQVDDIQNKSTSLGAGVKQALLDAGEVDLAGRLDFPAIEKDAEKLGINLETLPWTKIQDAVQKVTKDLTDSGGAAAKLQQDFEALTKVAGFSDAAQQAAIATRDAQRSLDDVRRQSATRALAVRDAERALADARTALNRFTQEVADDERNLTRARENQTDAANKLTDAEHRRNLVLADTGAGDREVADAGEALINTRSRLRDLDEEQVSIQRDLQEIAATSADKIAAADRNVERQTIAVNKAKREEQNLLNQINADKLGKIDLTGLSVDEIRTKLANTRASLDASQRIDQVATTTLAEQQTEAHLSTLDAEQQLKDTVAARAKIEIDLGEKKREDEQRLAALQVEREDGKRREIEQQNTLNDLAAGNTNHARELRDTEIEVRDAKRSQEDAAIAVRDASQTLSDKLKEQPALVDAVKKAQIDLNDKVRENKQLAEDIRDAELKVKQAIIDQKSKTAELIGDQKTINKLLTDRILLNASVLQGLGPEQAQAAKVQLANSLPALLSGAVGNFNGLPIDVSKLPPSFVQNIADQLINSPGNDVLRILKILLNQSGLKIPGLAQGAVVNQETFARIGEAGREVVLPLTRPARLAELLSHNEVLPPVLAALQKIRLPDPVGRTPQNFGQSPMRLEALGIRPGNGGGNVITADHWEYDVLTELRGLREDISKLDGGGGNFNIEVKGTDQEVLTRKMRREIERMIAERRR